MISQTPACAISPWSNRQPDPVVNQGGLLQSAAPNNFHQTISADQMAARWNAIEFPREPGTYALLFQRPLSGRIEVGRLGSFEFPAGFYLYVGSALGPGGLAGRLRRHLSPTRKIHWHVDYLDKEATLIEIWYSIGQERLEHDWAAVLGRLPGVQIPALNFGASDCRCESHLFYHPRRPDEGLFALAPRDKEQGSQG